ncbi:MAG: HNH endonuclease [Thermoplasmata archaeon]|nr:MAG: HNH endonuclease [Thermoplasmata archaeon]
MPPSAVKTLRDLIFWQYAKIISESAGFGKSNYRFIMNRFKKLQSDEIEWSSSIREWIQEKENPNQCIYCGAEEKLTVDHMIPLSRGGPDHPDNAVMVCSHCNSLKGNKRLYEFHSLENRNVIPRIAEGKYLKLLYDELERRKLLDIGRKNLSTLCEICDLDKKCPVPEDLTVYCLEGIFVRR